MMLVVRFSEVEPWRRIGVVEGFDMVGVGVGMGMADRELDMEGPLDVHVRDLDGEFRLLLLSGLGGLGAQLPGSRFRAMMSSSLLAMICSLQLITWYPYGHEELALSEDFDKEVFCSSGGLSFGTYFLQGQMKCKVVNSESKPVFHGHSLCSPGGHIDRTAQRARARKQH